MQLSKNFKLQEFLKSETARRNGVTLEPSHEHVANLKRLCDTVLEPLRDMFMYPMIITSGYRSPELNALIGGSKTSAHMEGRAADFEVYGVAPYDVCRRIQEHWHFLGLPIDQCILEFPPNGWTHIGIAADGAQPRYQFLTARRIQNQTTYLPGLVRV